MRLQLKNVSFWITSIFLGLLLFQNCARMQSATTADPESRDGIWHAMSLSSAEALLPGFYRTPDNQIYYFDGQGHFCQYSGESLAIESEIAPLEQIPPSQINDGVCR